MSDDLLSATWHRCLPGVSHIVSRGLHRKQAHSMAVGPRHWPLATCIESHHRLQGCCDWCQYLVCMALRSWHAAQSSGHVYCPPRVSEGFQPDHVQLAGSYTLLQNTLRFSHEASHLLSTACWQFHPSLQQIHVRLPPLLICSSVAWSCAVNSSSCNHSHWLHELLEGVALLVLVVL